MLHYTSSNKKHRKNISAFSSKETNEKHPLNKWLLD